MRLSGKTAIVTGGASGFGAGIVRKFAAEGARVMVADINGDAAKAFAGEFGDMAVAHQVDVSKRESVEAMRDEALARFGQLDILVNNAGVSHMPAPLDEISEADFDRVLAVNVKGVYLTSIAFVPHFKARKAGTILNVASTAAVSPRPRLSWYNASKGWLVTATKSMAVELAPLGIRVNAVSPGPIYFKGGFWHDVEVSQPELFKATVQRGPLGRLGKPEEIADMVAFLAGTRASFITGANVVVDGGYTKRVQN